MPVKVGKITTSVSVQSVSNPSNTETGSQVGAGQDSDLTVVEVRATRTTASVAEKSDSSGSTSSKTRSKKQVVQAQANKTVQAPGLSQSVTSAKKDLQSGKTVSAARARESAQGAIKAVKSATSTLAGDLQSVLTQKSKRASSGAVTNVLAAGPGSANPAIASARAGSRGSSRRRSGTHISSWAAPTSPPAPASVVNLNTEDQVYKYGLYLLRPEIITLFDSDPLYEIGLPTDTSSFLSMQFSYAKSLQEASYRRTRKLLSGLSYLPSLGFNESDLLPIDPVTAIESAGSSLFEQAVSKWDAHYTSTLAFEASAAELAISAQDVASTLDIANMASNSTSDEYSFSSLKTLIDQAIQENNTAPTAAQYTLDSEFSAITFEGSFDMHGYLRDSSDGASFIASLINTDSEIGTSFRSYTLMHTLLQQAFISFAFGTSRDSTASDLLSRTRDETDPQSAYKFVIGTGPLGKLASKSSFYDPLKFGEDAAEISASVSSSDTAKAVLLRLVSLATYKSSVLYDSSKTALDVFQEYIGLPVALSADESGSGKPISDFEEVEGQTSAGLLFQITSVDSARKMIFFDRSHNPGLPSGYTHGYTRLFGDASSPAQTASDLVSRMTSAIAANNTISQKILASDISRNRTTYKPADLGKLLMENFAGLLETKWDGETFSTYYDSNDRLGFQTAYLAYLEGAGTNQSSFARTKTLVTENTGANSFFGVTGSELLPVYADHEVVRFLTLSHPFTGSVADWAKEAVNVMMTYWSQRFDYATGISSSPPETIKTIIYGTNPITEREIKSKLASYYGQTTYLVKLGDYAEPALDRLVTWSISTAYAIFGSAGTSGNRTRASTTPLPTYSSLIANSDGSTSYTFKEVCLLLVLFASAHMQSIFEKVQKGEYDPYNPYTKFKDSAETIVNELASHAPVSYDDARLCLGILNAQLNAAIPGLQKIVSQDLLTDGKFNLIYTPCQAAAMTIRRYEYLYRKQRAPFHCPRYDETAISRALERSAIRALYRTDLMSLPDTRVLVVGMPAGIQHVIGLGQRYAKVTITRRDQASVETTYNTVSFIFDMFTFISPDTSRAFGSTPWTATSDGSITDVTDVNFFRIGKSIDTGLGNLSSHTCTNISLSYVPVTLDASDTSVLETTETGASVGTRSGSSLTPSSMSNIEDRSSDLASPDVSVSDLIVDVEFIDEIAAASDLGTTVDALLNDPRIVGNHLVDYLLKTHMKNVSGVDMTEAAFTTSSKAFTPNSSLTLGATQSYVLDICAVDFLNLQTAESADLEASIRHLDILSKTPIIRSSEYADLCTNHTYFDRVFALPINISQFTAIGEDEDPAILELLP